MLPDVGQGQRGQKLPQLSLTTSRGQAPKAKMGPVNILEADEEHMKVKGQQLQRDNPGEPGQGLGQLGQQRGQGLL